MNAATGKVPKSAGKRTQPKGGSRKGKPNKITADVKAMILEALNNAGGAKYLQTQALESPAAFMALVGKVLPLTVAGDPSAPLLALTDEALNAKLTALLQKLEAHG